MTVPAFSAFCLLHVSQCQSQLAQGGVLDPHNRRHSPPPPPDGRQAGKAWSAPPGHRAATGVGAGVVAAPDAGDAPEAGRVEAADMCVCLDCKYLGAQCPSISAR
jgi:hypothetical protein